MMSRRRVVQKAGATVALGTALPVRTRIRDAGKQPGVWREFEMAHRIEVEQPKPATRVREPLPCIGSRHRTSLDGTRSGDAQPRREACRQDCGAPDPDRVRRMITAREINA